jgi:hypothetical protein
MSTDIANAPQPPESSSLLRFLEELAQRDGVDGRFAGAIDAARGVLLETLDSDGPFLSILMRTQGRRLEPFKDAMLCLAAQSSLDFELILLAHDVEPDALAQLRHVVSNQTESLKSRTTIVEVEGGGRARPLNRGVSAARGRYIAVYDDDDLLFANWVEAFAEAAEVSNGKMLRAITATQRAVPEVWPQGGAGFRTGSWPNAEYARTFDQLDHLVVNHSPFMSVAFPRYVFNSIGLAFDEELDVCEDWDVILQGSLLVGVHSIDALTSIYRRWEGGASSYTAHSRDEWARSEARVIDRLNRDPQLFAAGSVLALRSRRMLEEHDDTKWQLHQIRVSRSWRFIQRVRHILAPPRRVASAVRRRMRRALKN